jgi:hypothetical protein
MLRACKPLESNSFYAISQNRERPCRSAATCRSHVSLEKIRKPVACRMGRAKQNPSYLRTAPRWRGSGPHAGHPQPQQLSGVKRTPEN